MHDNVSASFPLLRAADSPFFLPGPAVLVKILITPNLNQVLQKKENSYKSFIELETKTLKCSKKKKKKKVELVNTGMATCFIYWIKLSGLWFCITGGKGYRQIIPSPGLWPATHLRGNKLLHLITDLVTLWTMIKKHKPLKSISLKRSLTAHEVCTNR